MSNTAYLQQKKNLNLVFTHRNINPAADDRCVEVTGAPVEKPAGPSWWDHTKGRYRTAAEQKAYVAAVEKRAAEAMLALRRTK